MVNHKQTLSVIIPAHNEELNLKACIDSVLNQEHPVDEIVVISNGSTDNTTQIAKSFKNVKVIEIKKKGLINARDIGFDYSQCDILARINADVICEPNWSKVIHDSFRDTSICAVAGVARTWTMVFMPNFLTTFWSKIYLNFVEAYFGVPVLWGSNMVLRKSAWQIIKNSTCKNDSAVHEDQDVSIHLSVSGLKIIKDARLLVINKEESYFDWNKLTHYNNLRKKTKKTHLKLLKESKIKLNIFERSLKMLYVLLPGIFFGLTSALYRIIKSTPHYLFYKRHL